VGEVGPILDDLKPDAERVKAAVVNGIGVMPAYEETLTQEQIDAVARYVATAVGQSK
jgi:mono/diheme cytochrome c family protein